MLTDIWHLVRNVAGLYRPKTLTQALAEYDQIASQFDPRVDFIAVLAETDLTFEELEAIQVVAEDCQRDAGLAAKYYTACRARVASPEQYQRIRLILVRWAEEEAHPTEQAA